MEDNNGDGDMMQQEMMMGSNGMYGNMNGMGYQIQNDIIPEEDI